MKSWTFVLLLVCSGVLADSLHVGLILGAHRSEGRALLHWSHTLQARGHQITLFLPEECPLPASLFAEIPSTAIHRYSSTTSNSAFLDQLAHVHSTNPMHILLAGPRADLAAWINPPHTPLWVVTEPALIGSPYREWIVGHQVLPPWLRELSEDWTPHLPLGDRLFRQWNYYWSFIRSSEGEQAWDWIEQEEEAYGRHPALVTTFVGMEWPIPIPTHVKLTGLPSTPSASLSESLAMELSQPFLVLDWNKQGENAWLQSVLFSTFKELDPSVAIVWWREDGASTLPESERVKSVSGKDVDLLALLKHPQCQGLVSECGVSSVHDALASHTRLLCLPTHASWEPYRMALHVTRHKWGRTLSASSWNVSTFHEALVTLTSPSLEEEEALTRWQSIARVESMKDQAVCQWIETVYKVGAASVLPPVSLPRGGWMYHEGLYILLILLPLLLSMLACLLATHGIRGLLCCCLCCCRPRTKLKRD